MRHQNAFSGALADHNRTLGIVPETIRETTDAYDLLEQASRRATDTIMDGLDQWMDGTLDVKSALKGLALDLSEMALQRFVMNPLEREIGGVFDSVLGVPSAQSGGSSFLGDAFTSLFHGIPFGATPVEGLPWLHAAGGADFIVNGPGGVDSQFLPMMVTPGERVRVETPEQQRAGDGFHIGNITVNVQGGINNSGRKTEGQVAAGIARELARQSRRNN